MDVTNNDTKLVFPSIIYGDINREGEVNSTDLTLLKRYILKIITLLPCENLTLS